MVMTSPTLLQHFSNIWFNISRKPHSRNQSEKHFGSSNLGSGRFLFSARTYADGYVKSS